MSAIALEIYDEFAPKINALGDRISQANLFNPAIACRGISDIMQLNSYRRFFILANFGQIF